jgi:hypothetical protein
MNKPQKAKPKTAWEAAGISRSTWYRAKKAGSEGTKTISSKIETVSKSQDTETFSKVQEKSKDGKPWQIRPGQVLNPTGRPKGSRNKLNEAFVSALCADFIENGIGVIQLVRAEKPDVYLKVVASLQPKEIDLNDKRLEQLTDSEIFDALAVIRSIKAGLNGEPAGGDRQCAPREKAPRRQLN